MIYKFLNNLNKNEYGKAYNKLLKEYVKTEKGLFQAYKRIEDLFYNEKRVLKKENMGNKKVFLLINEKTQNAIKPNTYEIKYFRFLKKQK